jgi:hypothetical protein
MSEKAENSIEDSKLNLKDGSFLPLNDKTVVVGADGSLTMKGTQSPQSPDSKLLEIIEKLGSADFEPLEVHRLIAVEIALVTRAMGDRKDNSDAATVLKEGLARVKALRSLAKAIEKFDSLTKRDVLNFDGPKFQFVFDELLSYYDQAVKEALGKSGEAMAQQIIKNFRDIIAKKEADLRRMTAKIGTPGAD